MSKLEYPGELHIYLLNDSSTDETGEIAQYYDDSYAHIHHIEVPPGTPRGKSRVLNYGISISMIALEFSAFQLLMQAGRWGLFKLGSLTGTNLIIRRDILERVGGYDPYALAEDADLTLTLTHIGGLLPIVPDARTWEQEPENFKVWLRQRTRWMQGNLYLIEKTIKNPRLLRGRNFIHSAQLILVYICFVFFLLVSDVWFLLGLAGKVQSTATTPLLILWFELWLMYYVQLVTAQMSDKTLRPIDLLVSFLMYFSYAQLWLFLLIRGVYYQIKLKLTKKEPIWDKTARFKQGRNIIG